MKAFRKDAYLWMQVAEDTYDSFMIRKRTRELIARTQTTEGDSSGAVAICVGGA